MTCVRLATDDRRPSVNARLTDVKLPAPRLRAARREVGRTPEVRSAYEQAGGSGTSGSIRTLVHRLGRRVADVGLRLHVVRGRGLVLDVDG